MRTNNGCLPVLGHLLLLLSLLTILSARTIRVDVVCTGVAGNSCIIGDVFNATAASQVHFPNIDASNRITLFNLSSGAVLPAIPTQLFATFPHLTELIISSNVTACSAEDFRGAVALTDLKLMRNRIGRLPTRLFAHAKNLEEIDLAYNQITVIEPEAFDGLSNLETLILRENRIAVLHARTFAGADNLNLLDLDYNGIAHLDERILALPELEMLYVGFNRLRQLADGCLAGAPNLVGIDFSGNQLSSIGDSIYRLRHLQTIALNRNGIGDLSLRGFAAMPALIELELSDSGLRLEATTVDTAVVANAVKILDISRNNLTDARLFSALAHFPQLETLDISYNQLRELNMGDLRQSLPKISKILAMRNMWDCKWLKAAAALMTKYHIEFVVEDHICA